MIYGNGVFKTDVCTTCKTNDYQEPLCNSYHDNDAGYILLSTKIHRIIIIG